MDQPLVRKLGDPTVVPGTAPGIELVAVPDPLIIHHFGCVDGFVGALLFWIAFDGQGEYRGAQYEDEAPPDEELVGRDVYLVDFSYPRAELERMAEAANHLLVLDHHKTARDNCAGLPFCVFDMTRSGAMLAFDVLKDEGLLQTALARRYGTVPGLPQPGPHVLARLTMLDLFVQYVQDRDLWRWDLDYSREMSAALSSYPRRSIKEHAELWVEQVLFRDHERLQEAGEAILHYQERLVEMLKAKAWAAELDGRAAAVVGAPVLQSEVGEALLADPTSGAEVAVMWMQKSNGRFIYSLRSADDGPDVSRIAKVRGGGGHEHAAGFSSERPPWQICAVMSDWGGGA